MREFARPVFLEGSGSSNAMRGPADSREHELLTKVYTDLGFIEPKHREAAEGRLKARIAAFREQHRGDIQPLVAVPLVSGMGLRAVVGNFDKGQSTTTFVVGELWDQYDLHNLNRRSVGGRNNPRPWSVVGMPLAADNAYGEPGLTLTEKTTREQRKALGASMVANAVDWLALASIRREMNQPLPDNWTADRVGTVTRFPQMDELPVGRGRLVGCARSLGSKARLIRSNGARRDHVGVRRLVGSQ